MRKMFGLLVFASCTLARADLVSGESNLHDSTINPAGRPEMESTTPVAAPGTETTDLSKFGSFPMQGLTMSMAATHIGLENPRWACLMITEWRGGPGSWASLSRTESLYASKAACYGEAVNLPFYRVRVYPRFLPTKVHQPVPLKQVNTDAAGCYLDQKDSLNKALATHSTLLKALRIKRVHVTLVDDPEGADEKYLTDPLVPQPLSAPPGIRFVDDALAVRIVYNDERGCRLYDSAKLNAFFEAAQIDPAVQKELKRIQIKERAEGKASE